MISKDDVQIHFKAHNELLEMISNNLEQNIVKTSLDIANGLKSGATLFFCGNGGSASDSQHLAAEFIGRFKNIRRPLKSISLNTDTSVITAIANDFGYDEIYSRQLEGLGKKNDMLFVISTSGRSPNVINALLKAKNMNIKTFSLLGKTGGEALVNSDNSILIPSDQTDRIQEFHILIGHIICALVEKELDLA